MLKPALHPIPGIHSGSHSVLYNDISSIVCCHHHVIII